MATKNIRFLLKEIKVYYDGGKAGEPLPQIIGEKIAKHTKGDQDGHKAERPNIRELNKGMFTRIESVEELFSVLFNSDKNIIYS
jgi:hypothetical protein